MFYLDYAATTPVLPDVLEVSLPYLKEHFANPSSVYDLGIRAAKAVKESRHALAKIFQIPSGEITFCSGATESNHLALVGCAYSKQLKGNQFIVSSIEHPSIQSTAEFLISQGFDVDYIRVLPDGIIDMDHFESLVSKDTRVVSCIAVNNEIGTLQPLNDIAKVLRRKNAKAVFHVDATQAIGKIPFSLKSQSIDMISLSGHKFGAPKGIGALLMTHAVPIVPLMKGGGQENGRRGGTENVFGIVALAESLRIAEFQKHELYEKITAYRDRWIHYIRQNHPKIQIYTSPHVLPYYLNIAIPGIPAEVFLHHLESLKIYVSTGSACSSKKSAVSHVWQAINVSPDLARSMIRMSFSAKNIEEDWEELSTRFSKAVNTLEELL